MLTNQSIVVCNNKYPLHSSSSSKMYNSSIATSTPNLPASTPRRKKAKAPPPPVITVSETPRLDQPCTSMDDVASISSLSSYNSTIHSDQVGTCYLPDQCAGHQCLIDPPLQPVLSKLTINVVASITSLRTLTTPIYIRIR